MKFGEFRCDEIYKTMQIMRKADLAVAEAIRRIPRLLFHKIS